MSVFHSRKKQKSHFKIVSYTIYRMIISGERIQELCDIYCGMSEDFSYNPLIRPQVSKQLSLNLIQENWNNPRIIFCYTHRLTEFINILSFLENDFILVTHNSDGNITDEYLPLLNNPKLIFWHAQNTLILHPKLGSIPIGIANNMWPHGNKHILESTMKLNLEKVHSVYFNFSINTNYSERSKCYESLKDTLHWQASKPFQSYLETLATYKYAICPPGNGIDCHRIWECLYLGVIPILLRSTFTEKLHSVFPCILLSTWNDFDLDILTSYIAPQYTNALTFDRLKKCIHSNTDYFLE